MTMGKISRRDWMVGAVTAAAAGALPLAGFVQSGEPRPATGQQAPAEQKLNPGSGRARWMQSGQAAYTEQITSLR
jgi:hypothetical protein